MFNHPHSPNIRILMLAPCLGKFGGIESFCLTLIEDLVKKGFSVSLLRKKVSGFHDDGSIDRNESEIRSTWLKNESDRFQSIFVEPRDPLIQRYAQESSLVHLHNPMVEGMKAAKKNGIPCVVTVYNWRRKGIHPRLWVWRWVVSQCARRWYISEFVWNTWEKSRKKNSARLPVVSRMPTGEYPRHKRKGFLFIGRWVPNKGIRILIEAYRRISPDPKVWPLIMLGDGPLRNEIGRMIETEKIQGVEVTGFVSEQARMEFSKQAKWMVTPPHTKEDLGLTPLEARSVGVPCIASRDGGVKETAGTGALFCEPGSIDSLEACLRQAISMPEEDYRTKSKLAKKNLSEYVRPLDEYAEQYLSLLA